MGLSEVGYGLLLTSSAVGTIAGTTVAGTVERRLGKPNLFVASVVVLAAGNVALASSTNPFVIGGVLAIGGIFHGAFSVVYQSLRQRIVPDRILGRLVATFRMLGWGALPLGALLGGLVAEALGLTAVFWAAAVIAIVLLPVRLLITDSRIAEAEAAAVAERASLPAPIVAEAGAGE
jgi:MFS family permease